MTSLWTSLVASGFGHVRMPDAGGANRARSRRDRLAEILIAAGACSRAKCSHTAST
jgi:hypothetical protein